MKGTEFIKVIEIVKTFDLSPIASKDGNSESFRFRIEIIRDYKSHKSFRARVWRIETYRIQPTFPQRAGTPKIKSSDEVLLVEDTTRDWAYFVAGSPDAILKKIINEIETIFKTI